MRRSRIIYLALFLLVLGAGAFLTRYLLAAEAPLAGTWKVKILDYSPGEAEESSFCLLKVTGKDRGEILGVYPDLEKGTLKDLKTGPKSLHFTLMVRDNPFVISAHVPAGETRPTKLLGSLRVNSQIVPVQLEQTSDTEITKKNASRNLAAGKEIENLARGDIQKRQEILAELLKNHKDTPLALLAIQIALHAEAGDKAASEKQVGELARQYTSAAQAFGPEMEQNAALTVARTLLQTPRKALALEYARKAEKDIGKDVAAEQRFEMLNVLHRALEANGKKAQAANLATELDEAFEKMAVPFEVKPFKGREGDSTRVALVELFTGAQCPPCVGADVAFDAALKAYKPTDAVFLQYHLHIPGPDPLTNKATEERQKYYNIEGTPTTLVDGEKTPGLGGPRQAGKVRFETLSKLINAQLETAVAARVKLSVKRDGDKVDMQADVGGLKKPGKNVRLRFVLVEEVARFQGNNKQRLHHHVVRDFPGGVAGQAVKSGDTVQASVALDKLRKDLKKALDEMDADALFHGERPLAFTNLKIVAFVQDDDSKKILQAAQADVPEAK